jgi:hypothetical protein
MNGMSTTPQQLTHQVSLLGNTLETIVLHKYNDHKNDKQNNPYTIPLSKANLGAKLSFTKRKPPISS